MKVFYTTSSGESKVEEIRPHVRLIEMPDGLHSISKSSVFRDIEDKRNSMVFIWQDVSPAEGGSVTNDSLLRIEVAKSNRQSVEIARLWKRRLRRVCFGIANGIWFSIFLLWIALVVYVLYAVVTYYV